MLLVLPGCWVSSINPLYEETTIDHLHVVPDDVVLDPSLIGSWTTTDDKCPTQLTIAAKGQIYDLQLVEEGQGCSQDRSHRQARMVKLDSHYFLDVSPMDDAVCDMCAAKHDILLLKIDKAALSFTPIDSDWLKKSIEAKTVTLSTVAGDTDTITASSKDLKAFCRQFADSKEVFKTESALMFKRK
ncbi:MAG: hypothetical protein ABSF93_14995 [Candidatus Sulfotelmatobacter sp.]